MSAGSLFYPPSPAQGDGSLTTHSSAIRVSKYLYSDSSMDAHTGASGQPSQGLLNGYMSVPLASPLDRADLDENNAPVEQVIKATPSKHPRLLSLDCFRGLTIAWMIQSDEGGDAWTHTCDHSPWNGLHFADFVFPAFVFIVGMAVPLSTQKFASDRIGATKKALWRAIKMFLVGFIAASGGFPKPASENDPSDYRLSHIRIPGILQRIAFCYFITVCIHVWVPVREPEPSPNSIAYGRTKLSLYKKYLWHWIAAVILLGIWFILMFGTNVPGCGYGNLDQECNAAGYWDRMIIGSRHMYAHPTLNRSPECSWNSPGYDPIPGAPAWCTKPFDPEGIAGSFTACVTGFFGLFFGLVLSNEQKHERRLTHWLSLSGVSMVVGLILHFSGVIPMNKNLWSPAYVFVMVGVDGAVFSIFYYLVDMKLMKKVLFPMICMGMNAILVFVVAQSDISLDTLIQWFYLDQPTDNLYHWYRVNFLQQYFGDDWGIFLWAITKVCSWFGISVLLYKLKIFWKL